MKKLVKIILALMLLMSAFFMGRITGEKSVIMNQEIWEEDGFFFSDYKGQIHYYEGGN